MYGVVRLEDEAEFAFARHARGRCLQQADAAEIALRIGFLRVQGGGSSDPQDEARAAATVQRGSPHGEPWHAWRAHYRQPSSLRSWVEMKSADVAVEGLVGCAGDRMPVERHVDPRARCERPRQVAIPQGDVLGEDRAIGLHDVDQVGVRGGGYRAAGKVTPRILPWNLRQAACFVHRTDNADVHGAPWIEEGIAGMHRPVLGGRHLEPGRVQRRAGAAAGDRPCRDPRLERGRRFGQGHVPAAQRLPADGAEFVIETGAKAQLVALQGGL